jgi:hypothetical protein
MSYSTVCDDVICRITALFRWFRPKDACPAAHVMQITVAAPPPARFRKPFYEAFAPVTAPDALSNIKLVVKEAF